MMGNLKRFFYPPKYDDDEKTRIAGILHVFLLIVLSIFVIHLLLELAGVFELKIEDLVIEGSMVVLLFGLLVANRHAHTQTAGLIFVFLLWLAFTLLSFSNRGLRGTAVVAYTAILATAGMLLGWRAVAGFALLSFISIISMAYVETAGLLNPTLDNVYSVAIELNFLIVWGAVALIMATRGLSNALQRARQSEQSLLERNRELEDIQVSLAEQVATRTQGLELVAALGERLNAILNIDQMLNELVNQVQANFGYYHVQVLLVDESGENLVASAGTGEVGQTLQNQGFTIAQTAQTSLIARAARSNRPVLVQDVSQAPDWLSDPLLAETKAEVAIPITLEGKVVGVLDVQDNQLGRVDESDANILRSLANQVAVAIRNARLFAQVETALAQTQAAQERYVAQTWQAGSGVAQQARVQRQGAPEVDETLAEQLHQTAAAQVRPSVVEPDAEHKAIVSPIKLQNQVIGTMQFFESGQSSQWSEQELALVQAIADQVAQTAENLRLFDETRQRADYERLVGEITQEIRQAPNLDALTKTATEAISRALGVSHGGVSFNLPVSQTQAEHGNGHGQ